MFVWRIPVKGEIHHHSTIVHIRCKDRPIVIRRTIVTGLAAAAIAFAILGWIGYWVPIYREVKINDRFHAYFYTHEGLARFYWLRADADFYIDSTDNYVSIVLHRADENAIIQRVRHASPNAIQPMALVASRWPSRRRENEVSATTAPTMVIRLFGARTWIWLPLAILAAYPTYVIVRDQRHRRLVARRGRRGLCVNCGYDLTGLTEPRCPACGETIVMSETPADSSADFQGHVLRSAITRFKEQKTLADRAVGQLSFEKIKQSLDPETNSVAVIMKHMAGNMRSRWTDFLTSDGEKPWRARDGEFIDEFATRDELSAFWETGWECLFATLSNLTADDLAKTVHIRGEPLSAIDAILRQIDHYGYHVGQIVMIARILAKDHWKTLTIPRGQSEEFNRRSWKK